MKLDKRSLVRAFMNADGRRKECKYLCVERLGDFPQDVRCPIGDTFYYGAYSWRCAVLAYEPEYTSTGLGVLDVVYPSGKKGDYRER